MIVVAVLAPQLKDVATLYVSESVVNDTPIVAVLLFREAPIKSRVSDLQICRRTQRQFRRRKWAVIS